MRDCSLNYKKNTSSPYCGLTDARMRASEKDLPVVNGPGDPKLEKEINECTHPSLGNLVTHVTIMFIRKPFMYVSRL